MTHSELLVIDRTYELLKWFLGRLEKFPRSHRYGLGQRIEARLFLIFESLIQAKYSAAQTRSDILARINLDLETLRMLTRLAHDMKILPHKSYEYAGREVNEIGRMVGGWHKHRNNSRSSRS